MFGVQGGAIMPVYDALFDSDIHHVTMAHEQGASHAADAYGVVKGDPGVCLATSGPGATNLVTGIADANMDSDAMVALTGQVPSGMVGSDAFQETDTTGVTTPITKHNYFAGDADTVGDMVGEAFALAETGRPGPTLVDLPKDATLGETDDPEPGKAETPETYSPQMEAESDAVEAAARAIERRRKTAVPVRRRRRQGRGLRGGPTVRHRTRDPRGDDDARHRVDARGPRPLSVVGGDARHRLRQHGRHAL